MPAGSISRSAAVLGLDGSGPIDIFSMGGLILCQALASTPFVFLLLSAALRSMDPALEEASGTSGASPLTTFRRVTFPVLLPGLLAPLILITLITAEQFELPLIIGLPAKINVFSYRIYFELNPLTSLPNYGAAAALSLPFVVLGVLLLLRLQPPDQARRQLRHHDGKGLPAAAAAARRLARFRRSSWPASMSRSPRSFRPPCCCGRASSAMRCRSPPRRPISASRPIASFSPIGRSGSDCATRSWWRSLSAVIVTLIGTLLGWIISRSQLRDSTCARFRVGALGRNSGGDRRARR